MAYLQRGMAELFQKALNTINEHITNIYDEGELNRDSTIRNFRIVQREGNREVARDVTHYNLELIISVGYRVNSYRGTQFRIWATQKLTEFIKKGFVLDDDRLATDNKSLWLMRGVGLLETPQNGSKAGNISTQACFSARDKVASQFRSIC